MLASYYYCPGSCSLSALSFHFLTKTTLFGRNIFPAVHSSLSCLSWRQEQIVPRGKWGRELSECFTQYWQLAHTETFQFWLSWCLYTERKKLLKGDTLHKHFHLVLMENLQLFLGCTVKGYNFSSYIFKTTTVPLVLCIWMQHLGAILTDSTVTGCDHTKCKFMPGSEMEFHADLMCRIMW